MNNNNYEYIINNLDFLKYKASFNNLLNEFLILCNKYHIKLYYIDNKIYIFKKDKIIDQIILIKHNIINNHIELLNNFLKSNYNKYDYINYNFNFINNFSQIIDELDNFIKKTEIIYKYDLLSNNQLLDNINYEINNEVEKKYKHLINLNKITFIDDYITNNIN
jgi:hypothetical protein